MDSRFILYTVNSPVGGIFFFPSKISLPVCQARRPHGGASAASARVLHPEPANSFIVACNSFFFSNHSPHKLEKKKAPSYYRFHASSFLLAFLSPASPPFLTLFPSSITGKQDARPSHTIPRAKDPPAPALAGVNVQVFCESRLPSLLTVCLSSSALVRSSLHLGRVRR